MFKHIGEETRALVERARARRQSLERWFMDRDGHVWINRHITSPLTAEEWEAIDEAVREFANTSHEVH